LGVVLIRERHDIQLQLIRLLVDSGDQPIAATYNNQTTQSGTLLIIQRQ
jgi:hypothetical protein